MHLKGRMLRESDSINQSVYDEQPFYVELEPRVRTYKTKAHRNKIIDRSKEKEEIRRLIASPSTDHASHPSEEALTEAMADLAAKLEKP